MNAKNLLSIGLLLLVAAAVVLTVVRESGSKNNQDTSRESTDNAILPADGLVVYYFHGNVRCPTCRDIEAYAHQALEAEFTPKLDSGEVEWRVVNYESPANIHFVDEYEIVSPTVVLVRAVDGEVHKWQNLMRVWELVSEKDAFAQYIQEQVHSLLNDQGS